MPVQRHLKKSKITLLGRKLCLGLSFVCSFPIVAQEKQSELKNIPSYDKAYAELVFPFLAHTDDEPTDDYLAKVRSFLERSDITPEQRYLGSRRLAGYFPLETRALCQMTPPQTLDFYFRSSCVIADPNLSYSEKKDIARGLLNQLANDSEKSDLPVRVAMNFADLANEHHDSSWALFLLEKSLASAHSPAYYYRVKSRLGLLYGNEWNSPETIQKAIDYLIDSEAYWRQTKLLENADFTLHALAGTLIRARQDYREALRHLTRIILPIDQSHVLTFSYIAFAQMKLGNQGQAKEYLAKFDREKKDDSAYSRHAMCLIQIVRYQLLQDQNLSSCVARADQELGLYIPFVTRELSQLALSKEMELTMWRQYQRYMETKLLPGLQMAFDQGTNEIEVETARMEALLQREKAQNLQQYERYTQIMLLFSLGLCTLVGLLVWFFRKLQRNHRQLADKKKEIEQLNRIIEAENVSIQKAMRLEIESKFNLASDAAHRLNNPLNYIHVGAELLLQKARTVAREIDEIFKNVDGNNPESKQLIQHFRNHLDEAETASQSLRLGVSQAIESVMEIRGLAGVDGYKVEPLSLLVLLEEALARLADHLGADAAHFVRYSAQEWSQLKIEGNRYLMKNALEIFLRRIVEKEHRDVRIGLGTEIDKSHFVITVEGLQEGKEDEQWLDVEDRLNYLLHNLNIKVRITKNSEEISMHWMSSQTLLIFQQNTDQPLKNLA